MKGLGLRKQRHGDQLLHLGIRIVLLEVNGGTYEKVAFFLMNEDQGEIRESTKRREAYFMDFAQKVRAISDLPLLITGGFRTFDFCNEILEKGELDLIGMARPFITDREKIADFIEGNVPSLDNLVIRTGIKQFEDAAEAGYYARQLIRMSKGKKFRGNLSPLWSSNYLVLYEMRKALSKRL